MIYLHRNGEHRQIALILMIMTITIGISWASMQCKMVVMDVHMKRCRLGVGRTKRAMEKFDLQKYDEKSNKRQEEPDYSKVNYLASHDAPQKRQLIPRRIGDIVPIVIEAVNEVKSSTASGTGYYEPDPNLVARGRSGNYPSSFYALDRNITPFRAPDENLDLNNEELDELYNDIYKRQPRASKEEAWKAFLETASKCCQNIDRCKKESTHIPCLAIS